VQNNFTVFLGGVDYLFTWFPAKELQGHMTNVT